jgi:hypothetical protein
MADIKTEERYDWKLSPSEFEASKGCACYDEEESAGAIYKERGEDLHALAEHEDAPLDHLAEADREAVEFCRGRIALLREAAGPWVFEAKELYIRKSFHHPSGKLDWIGLNEKGMLFVRDHKFGTMAVPSPDENPQIKAYLLMGYHEMVRQGRTVTGLSGGILQPALDLDDYFEFALADLGLIESELKAANARIKNPFKQPDTSDPSKCARCMYVSTCPAVCKAVTVFGEANNLLPAPDVFEPGAIVSERQRVIAQDFAKILAAWAEQVMRNNKEYAAQNGGSLGGIWNISARGNGIEITDIGGFAQGLHEAGLLEDPQDILQHVKIRKTALLEALGENPETDKKAIAGIVADLEEKHGVPRPPVQVFRRGGKKQVAAAERALDVPQLVNPWKTRAGEE